jgi:hypothetical protein
MSIMRAIPWSSAVLGNEENMKEADNSLKMPTTINQLATLFGEASATIYRILRRTEERTNEEPGEDDANRSEN